MSGIERRTQERKIAARKAAETRKVRKAKKAQRAGPQLDLPVEAESDEDLPLYTDLVLQQVEDMIDNWEPPSTWSEWFAETKRRDRNTLKSMLDGAISANGRDAVAKGVRNTLPQLSVLLNGFFMIVVKIFVINLEESLWKICWFISMSFLP